MHAVCRQQFHPVALCAECTTAPCTTLHHPNHPGPPCSTLQHGDIHKPNLSHTVALKTKGNCLAARGFWPGFRAARLSNGQQNVLAKKETELTNGDKILGYP